MNEEEKKAIDKLQYTIEINQNILDGIEIDEQVIKSMETTLNLIDKQQKEIEKLKSRKYILNAETNEIKEIPISDDYISKDKIKEKIEEITSYAYTSAEERDCQDYAIQVLKELLEEQTNEWG